MEMLDVMILNKLCQLVALDVILVEIGLDVILMELAVELATGMDVGLAVELIIVGLDMELVSDLVRVSVSPIIVALDLVY